MQGVEYVQDCLPGMEENEILREVTHACPADGSQVTPCCGRTPFDLPRTDRLTLDPRLVTCGEN